MLSITAPNLFKAVHSQIGKHLKKMTEKVQHIRDEKDADIFIEYQEKTTSGKSSDEWINYAHKPKK